MSYDSPRLARFSGTTAALSTTEAVAIHVDTGARVVPCEINRIKIKRSSGANSATFVPRMHSASTVVAASITQEYVGSSTASTALFDATNLRVTCHTDANGYLHLVIAPNVANDVWDWQVDVFVHR